ncbi:MAG: OsmC family peroxiredoxin [Acidimicrobiia bacterium]|nr:OsmC family peroxiredoxin [Acidimicrobiia bacterium]
MALTSTGSAHWEGDLMSGKGTASLETSGTAGPLDVTWKARTEDHGGLTSPEELIAAAHAACFSMALSHGLAQAGTPATSLDATATATFGQVDGEWRIVSMALDVVGAVPGLDEDGFATAAEEARDGCPVSNALKGNVEITVTARLG